MNLCGIKKPLISSINKWTLILNLNIVQYVNYMKNPTDLFSNAKKKKTPNKQTHTPWNTNWINPERKYLPTEENSHYNQSHLSPTQSQDILKHNHIKSYWLRFEVGVSHHLTCSPSWYCTAACMASTSLSTRSFQVLFKASQAEFSCKLSAIYSNRQKNFTAV